MAVDPYSALGVPRGADKAEIKKAYRAKAKRTHPDAGGTVEQFGELQRCYDLLVDDTRRAHYDRTGEFQGREPDNAQANLLEMVSTLLDLVMQDAGQRGEMSSITFTDVIGKMTRKARDFELKSEQFQAHLRDGIKINRKLMNRFKRKKKSSEPNLMEMVIAGRVASMEGAITAEQDKLKKMREVIRFLGEYEFDVERAAQAPPRYQTIEGLSISDLLNGRVSL